MSVFVFSLFSPVVLTVKGYFGDYWLGPCWRRMQIPVGHQSHQQQQFSINQDAADYAYAAAAFLLLESRVYTAPFGGPRRKLLHMSFQQLVASKH
jgi:hypothetical protein